MKKGCFLTVISLLTVIIAVIIYIFKFHQDDLINVVKPFVLGQSETEVYKKIDKLSNRTYSDSLKKLVGVYVKDIGADHKIDMKNVRSFFFRTDEILNDGKIDSLELSEITQYIKSKHQK